MLVIRKSLIIKKKTYLKYQNCVKTKKKQQTVEETIVVTLKNARNCKNTKILLLVQRKTGE